MRRTLVLWNTIALLALFALLGVVVRGIVAAGMVASVDRELALRLRRFLERPPRNEAAERRGRGTGRGNPYRPVRFDRDGASVAPTRDHPLWDAVGHARALRGEAATTTVRWDGEPLRVLSLPVVVDGEVVGVGQAPYPVGELERAAALLDRTLLALLPLVALSAWAGALVLTGQVLRPVARLTAAAGRLGAENLSERLPVEGRDEFATLAVTFNGMLERLEAAFERQRRFTADASHELKTPLTQIKGLVDVALLGPPNPERLRRSLETVGRSADAMDLLVRDLLLLARMESGRGAERSWLEAGPLLETARERVARDGAAQVVVRVEPADLRIYGDPAALPRVLTNLIDNALRHTPPQGRVVVAAQPGRLTVSDTGCGIAPEHLPHLGERFYRVDGGRARQDGGTGLGLAICRGIVAAHGGAIAWESAVGEGTRVTIRLPDPDGRFPDDATAGGSTPPGDRPPSRRRRPSVPPTRP